MQHHLKHSITIVLSVCLNSFFLMISNSIIFDKTIISDPNYKNYILLECILNNVVYEYTPIYNLII